MVGAGPAHVRRDLGALGGRSRRVAVAQALAARVDAHLLARLGVDQRQLAGVLEGLLARVAHLDHEHVVACGEARERDQPVARAAQVADDHEQRALARDARRVLEALAQARVRSGGRVLVEAQGEQRREQAAAPLARAARGGDAGAGRDHAEAVAAPARDLPERERDALGDVGLAAVGRAELHRDRAVEHEPGRERPLGDVHADVRLVRAGRREPVHLAHVVARLVGADLRELGRDAEMARAELAAQHAVDALAHREVERAQRALGHRAGAGLRRCARRRECGDSGHATAWRARSRRGIRIESSTGWMTWSAVTSSASAW